MAVKITSEDCEKQRKVLLRNGKIGRIFLPMNVCVMPYCVHYICEGKAYSATGKGEFEIGYQNELDIIEVVK